MFESECSFRYNVAPRTLEEDGTVRERKRQGGFAKSNERDGRTATYVQKIAEANDREEPQQLIEKSNLLLILDEG